MKIVRVGNGREWRSRPLGRGLRAMLTSAVTPTTTERGGNLARHRSRPVSPSGFLASVSWPRIRPTALTLSCRNFANVEARGSMVWRSRTGGFRPMKGRSKRGPARFRLCPPPG